MDDRKRARFEEQQADITQLEHTVLTPFFQLIAAFKMFLLLIAVALCSLSAYIFGHLGGQGMYERQAKADRIYMSMEDVNRDPDVDWKIQTADLGHRSQPLIYTPDGPVMPVDPSGADPVGLGITMVGTVDGPAAGVLSDGINANLCNTGHDYNTALGPWSGRSDDALRRKSARMQGAYDNGVIMVSALRRMLVLMKLNAGNGLAANLTGREAAFFPGNTISLCNADAWQPGMTKETYDERARVSLAIELYAAPRVKTMYSGNRMVGISLRDRGDGSVDSRDLSYDVTWLGDILSSDPPLSDHQLYAVQRLNSVSTDDFWLEAAHMNCIHDDATVIKLASNARQYRDRLMFPKGKPAYIEFK